MRRPGITLLALAGFLIASAIAAAPAPTSYQAVEKTIARVRESWEQSGAKDKPNAVEWNALFDKLTEQLRAYTVAADDRERVVALNRLYQISIALDGIVWSPAVELRRTLRDWLRPRVRLAWAERKLVERVNGLPETTAEEVKANREKWIKFVNDQLGAALRKYDAAKTVAERQDALHSVAAAFDALQARNASIPWGPSLELQTALNDLCKIPNVDVTLDLATLTPILSQNLVTTGPVYWKGYVAQVTAGPKTGFGMINSDSGIAFYNKQRLSTYTNIWDFEDQIAKKDKRGKRLLKLYKITAASTDQQEVTAVVRLGTNGLAIEPSYLHNVEALIDACPQPGVQAAVSRLIASCLGYDREKIIQQIHDGAIGPMRENVEKEAIEMGRQKTNEELARRNAEIAKYLIGDDRLLVNNILIEALTLRSRTDRALIGGRLRDSRAAAQLGADNPQPTAFLAPDVGITADLHLISIANNFSQGAMLNEQVRAIDNLMIVTRNTEKGDSPAEPPVKVTRNVDFNAFLKAVAAAQEANDPKVQAIRLKRPTEAPQFGVDDKGNLVALINDFRVDVAAPPQAARGGLTGPPSKVYRIESPKVEVTLSFQIKADPAGGLPVVSGQIESVDLGAKAKVSAINDDEAKPRTLSGFTSTLFIGVLRSRIQGQKIEYPLDKLPIKLPTQDFAVRSVSPLDPSGWIRINLIRTSTGPLKLGNP